LELQRHLPGFQSAYQNAEKKSALLVRKQYQLLDAADDDDDVDEQEDAKRQKQGENEDKHKKHRRRKREEDVVDENEHIFIRRSRRKPGENEEAGRDRAREQDQQEKEELEERLLQKDAASTKKVGEFKLSKKQQELAKRVAAQEQISSLREASRQQYLTKRERQKLQALDDGFKDEMFLFAGTQLTAKVQADLRYKEEVHKLATQDVDHDVRGYHMPEACDKADNVRQDKRFPVALERYMNVEGEERANNWEIHQRSRATLKFGAEKRKEDNHKYVFEDQVVFIQATTIAGHEFDENEKKARVSTTKTGHERLLEDRKSLPIFAYRVELLDAIRKHQILVIEGETGS